MAGLERALAHDGAVQAELTVIADRIAAKADGLLEQHRPATRSRSDRGPSYIEVENTGIDRLVSLVDPGGAAAAIEYGRAGEHGGQPVQGLFILHRAADL